MIYRFESILICLVVLFVFTCNLTTNRRIMDKEERMRNYLLKYAGNGCNPGLQYAVTSPRELLYSSSVGSADIVGNVPLTKESQMMIHSMSKTFTAVAVLQLIDQGKLFLDDSARRYLPYIPYDEKVTIRHLLAQTSGIPDPIPLSWVHTAQEDGSFDEDRALREILEKYSKLNFEPGKRYSYSNISYWLLGKIVEKISGVSYKEYMTSKIFKKLNLSESEMGFSIPIGPRHVKGYLRKFSFLNLFKSFLLDSKFFGEYEGNWLHIRDHYLNGPSFGGIISNAESISFFLRDQLSEESVLFSHNVKSLFYQPQNDNQGNSVEMSLGWHIRSLNGNRYYFKEGGGGGFHSEMRIYPDRGIATVVISNDTEFNTRDFLNETDPEFFSK
ncbi:serine hydrolase domain-containing protein [Leptospira mayottensis]|uniref:Beta-lactamase n=2 Tax=Leptospira mayottensis TaxID=1137606 RepID=A0AA87MPZ0_9LEPT|nr:serine hydrolase domain-containing protein [Leptospira mayottensis]AXR63230.1 serine hydrolase [Leptospira mayottensis]EKS01212.1 beta-lactamase [Leptospira mayottensis 200901122]